MLSRKERFADVYVDKQEDTRERKRTMPMEVLCLGLSRTGTASMQAALEILGIPTWHWFTMSENTPDLAMWTEALQAKFEYGKPFGRNEFDNLLGHWGATTDQPVAFLAEDVMAAYPEAKVILVERNVDSWYKSYCDSAIAGVTNPFVPLGTMLSPGFLGQMNEQMRLVAKHYFHVLEDQWKFRLLNNPKFATEWKANARSTYLAHNERIKRITPKDQLLLFQLDQGWEPLCEFLGRPIPDVPFPKVNESAVIQEKVNLYIIEAYKRSMIKFARNVTPILIALLAIITAWWFTTLIVSRQL